MSMLPTFRSATEPQVESSYLSTAPGLILKAGTPTDEQFEDIRSRFGDPRANVKPDDYYTFRMIASGDGLDSYFTRQDLATSFVNFTRDLHKGQSLLGSHLMATFSYGSSFNGEVIPAEEDRAEYEGTFYPQWDRPDLRTKNWLVGDYFIGRGISVNGQSQDDLIRAIELGTIRKASISFMVGQYVCGLDGKDLVPSMFGPMPDGEECTHFPGIAYDGNIGWALMKHNTLVETSLVYKNASPSSMLLRKAEHLASRGILTSAQVDTLESRFQVRLPRFQPQVWQMANTSSNGDTVSASFTATGTTTTSASNGVRFDAQVQEEEDMANRRRGGNEATRDLVREVLTAEPEPEQDEPEVSSEAPEGADEPVTTAEDRSADEEAAAEEAAPEAETEEAADEAAAEGEAEEAEAEDSEPEEAEAEADAEAGVADEAEAEAEAEVSAAAEPTEEEGVAETEQDDSTREEEAVSAFVAAADRLANVIARNPDAFDTGLLAQAARAEKAVDLALIDAGCDATVGGQVARSFEIRSRKLNEALGEPLTVEAIRSLTQRAQLGEELFAELVKDAVAARVSAQSDHAFNADRYKEVLMGTRDVQYVKDEIASYQSQKAVKYAPGRQVVPRQPVDAKPSEKERKTLPTAPVALGTGKRQADAPASSLIQPRKK